MRVILIVAIILMAFTLVSANDCCRIRGDYNGDARVNIVDLVMFGQYFFGQVEPPVCMEAMDVDGSGSVNLFDFTYMVAYMFQGGKPPVPCK